MQIPYSATGSVKCLDQHDTPPPLQLIRPQKVLRLFITFSLSKKYTLQDRFSQEQIYSLDYFDFNLCSLSVTFLRNRIGPSGGEK